MSNLAEGQFQFSARSHQKEFPSLLHSSHPRGLLQPQPQFQFRIHSETQNLRWKSVLMLLISLQAPVLSDDSLQSQLQDQFQQMRSMISTFPGECQDPLQVHDSHSATISTMLSSFSVKYSTRSKNARDRSPQVNRPPLFNFHKQHRPQEDLNTYHSRNSVSIPVVQPTRTSTGEPVTVIAKVHQQQPPRPSSSPSTQPAMSYIVVDDQQPGSSRQMIYNPPSVAPSQ